MLLQIIADVEAAAYVAESFGVVLPPYTISLACGKDKRVTEIRVQKKVSIGSVRLPRRTIDSSGVMRIDAYLGDEHFGDLIDLLQYLESIGSFWFNIRRIHWLEGEFSWLPETAEEHRQLQLYSSRIRLEDPATPVVVEPAVLARTVNARSRLGHLTIPMSFFREGVNEYRALGYVMAFHNHYFFLEGLFGGGKTNNKQVERQFIQSPLLMEAVSAALQYLEKPGLARHRRGIDRFRKPEKHAWSPTGIVGIVVWMRGNLHHFAIRSSTPKGHPLNQREYESVAYLLQVISYEVVIRLAR